LAHTRINGTQPWTLLALPLFSLDGNAGRAPPSIENRNLKKEIKVKKKSSTSLDGGTSS
jgi:hypothetical protein